MALSISSNIGIFRQQQRKDVVIPFTEIANLLRNRLSGAEIDDLLATLVDSRTRVVQPGDLITADWAMDILNRLSQLEGGGSATNVVNQKAVRTLLKTWETYGRLASRQQFFPDGSGNDAIRSAVAITTAIQNVQIAAIAGAAIAHSIDRDGLIDLFELAYNAQHDLAVLLASPLPGVSNSTNRLLFAQRLTTLLDTDQNVTGKLSLKHAVAAKEVDAAVEAQDRVNGIVLTETGEAVVGTLEVGYRGSTRGEVLALRDNTAFGFVYRITNKTNKRFEAVGLKAEFAAPRDGWNGSVSILGGSGQVLSLKPFDASNPNDPGAYQDVTVNVTTPAGATKGQTGKLKLTASVPAPLSVAGFDTVTLTVDDAAVPAQPSTVKYSDASPVTEEGNPANATRDESIVLRFDARYTTTVGATPRDFRMKVSTANTAADFALFDIGFDTGTASSTNKSKTSTSITLRDGQQQSLLVQIVPGSASAGKTLALDFTFEAVDDTSVSVTKSRSITVKP